MNTIITSEGIAGTGVKEAWVKPEVNLLSVTQETLGGFILGGDRDGGNAS